SAAPPAPPATAVPSACSAGWPCSAPCCSAARTPASPPRRSPAGRPPRRAGAPGVGGGGGVWPRPELLERVAGRAGMVAMLTDRVDAELLDAAGPGLRGVANYAVGPDNTALEG